MKDQGTGQRAGNEKLVPKVAVYPPKKSVAREQDVRLRERE